MGCDKLGLTYFPGALASISKFVILESLTMNSRLFNFVGGATGPWSVTRSSVIIGPILPEVNAIDIVDGNGIPDADADWVLRGVTSNERYVTRPEKEKLIEQQELIGRTTSTHAALIPIRKTAEWWALTQDERRKIFEESSKHIAIGLDYLPAIARRLHHCRDLETQEPFDFLTYFEFNESDEGAFDKLLSKLRDSEEWNYVDREIDIRMTRNTN